MSTELPIDQPAPTLRNRLLLRADVELAIRNWFATTGALELPAPTLVPSPGMEPHLRAFRVDPVEAVELGTRYLHTSPEFAIKSVLGELGCDVFSLARCYRDEPPSRLHHAEFTMLEWYRRTDDLRVLMNDCESIVRAAANAAASRFGGAVPAELARPFGSVRCVDAFARHAGVDLTIADDDDFAAAAIRNGVDVGPDWDWDAVFTVIYADRVEPAIVADGPVFLTHFPARQAALARLDPVDPRWALRFELYVPDPVGPGAIELANAFAELSDAGEQRKRFERELAARDALGRPRYPMPEVMLSALPSIEPSAGIALGVERLLVWAAASVLGWRTCVADYLVAEPVRGLS